MICHGGPCNSPFPDSRAAPNGSGEDEKERLEAANPTSRFRQADPYDTNLSWCPSTKMGLEE
jgi:hypothetical protein